MAIRIHRPFEVVAFNANGMNCCKDPRLLETLYIYLYTLIICNIEIVHTDNRLIAADCDSGKGQTRPLVRERAPHQQNCNRLTVKKIWS
jgi:hypothetical protein